MKLQSGKVYDATSIDGLGFLISQNRHFAFIADNITDIFWDREDLDSLNGRTVIFHMTEKGQVIIDKIL